MNKIYAVIVLFTMFSECFAQDSLNVQDTLHIEFKNDLDRLGKGDSYQSVKLVLGKPKCSQYVRVNIDNKTIMEHNWRCFYRGDSCWIDFDTLTGRRMIRPRKRDSKLSVLLFLKGEIYINGIAVGIGRTKYQTVYELIHGDIKEDYTYFDSVVLIESHQRVYEFIFDRNGTLELIYYH